MKLVRDKRCTVIATTAVDMWAVGVIAYELMTGYPAFPEVDWTGEDIESAALGTLPYPWEGEVGTFVEIPSQLVLWRAVQGCLARSPQKRPSAATLLGQLNSLLVL